MSTSEGEIFVSGIAGSPCMPITFPKDYVSFDLGLLNTWINLPHCWGTVCQSDLSFSFVIHSTKSLATEFKWKGSQLLASAS